jgi:threonine dehydrogenase-like Zn-dependent dehydrogenase
MRQSYWTDGGIALHEVEPGQLQPGFVRMNVEACGICGSDLHRYRDTGGPNIGRQVAPGHEFVGTIVDANGANLRMPSMASTPGRRVEDATTVSVARRRRAATGASWACTCPVASRTWSTCRCVTCTPRTLP